MKKVFTIAILLVVSLILSGCIAPDGTTSAALKDCGSDPACFEEATQSCEPAKVTISREDESSIMELYSEIRGPVGDNCIFYLKVTKFEMKTLDVPLDSSEQELFDQLQEQFKTLKGKDMLCNIPQDAIGGTDLLSMENPTEICTGSLITAVEQLQ